MAGIIWLGDGSGPTWVATNWLFDEFLSEATLHLKIDEAALKVLNTAKETRDLELGLLTQQNPVLAQRLRDALRATAAEMLARGSEAAGKTKKYLDDLGQEVFLDKVREYLARDSESG